MSKLLVGTKQPLDLFHRVHHGRVVAMAEKVADLGERELEIFADKIHRDLTGFDNRRFPALAGEVFDS